MALVCLHHRQASESRSVSSAHSSINIPAQLTTRIAAYGDLYLIGNANRLRRPFRARVSNSGIPHVSVAPYFRKLENGECPEIYTAIVQVAAYRFLISGSYDESFEINDLLGGIKPSTIWTGEIAVFLLGKRVSFRSNLDGVRRAIHNDAISLFVSRMVEAFDLRKTPPKIIR